MKTFALTIRQLRTLCRIGERALIFRPRDIVATDGRCILRLPWVPDEERDFELRAADLAPWLRQQDQIAKIDGASYVTKVAIGNPHGVIRVSMVLGIGDDISDIRATRTSRAFLTPDRIHPRTIDDAMIETALGPAQPGIVQPFAFDPSLLRHAQRAYCHFAQDVGGRSGMWLMQAPGPKLVTWWGLETPHGNAVFALMPMKNPHTTPGDPL